MPIKRDKIPEFFARYRALEAEYGLGPDDGVLIIAIHGSALREREKFSVIQPSQEDQA